MKHQFLALTAAALIAGTVNAHAVDGKASPRDAQSPAKVVTDAAEPRKPEMRPDRPSPKMIEQKIADRLNLTPEQRKAVEKQRKADREKLKPLFEQMKEIRKQMGEIRKANMEAFQNILTPEQKAEFDKMMAERKAKGPHGKMKGPHKFGPRHPAPVAGEPNNRRDMPAGIASNVEVVEEATRDADMTIEVSGASAPIPDEEADEESSGETK